MKLIKKSTETVENRYKLLVAGGQWSVVHLVDGRWSAFRLVGGFHGRWSVSNMVGCPCFACVLVGGRFYFWKWSVVGVLISTWSVVCGRPVVGGLYYATF